MLILPAEHKINWQRPPIMTLGLILLNVFIFFRLDSQDSELYYDAYNYYVSHEIYVVEAPEYSDYLQRQVNLGLDNRFDLASDVTKAVNEGRGKDLVPYMLEDQKFVLYLQDAGREFLEPDVYNNWLPKRQHIKQEYLDHISYLQMGLIPSEIQLSDLLSYQFLHGGLMHLVGNMVMLFLLGFAIERILGKALFLLAYLFTGVCGGLLFAAVEGNSSIPLVGASAAISGLMGMYVSYYRLKKIRFFYFLFFYFNYFKAPALLVLPVWVGFELYGYFLGDQPHIAYMAHAGGLIAGAIFMVPWAHWYQTEFEEEDSQDSQDLAFRTELSKGMKATSQVDFDKARAILVKLHENHPHNADITLKLFHLYKVHPKDPECQRFTQLALENSLAFNNYDQAFRVLDEYQKYAANQPLSDNSYYFRLLNGCLSSNRMKEAESMLEIIIKTVANKQLVAEGFRTAIQVFYTRELPLKAKKFEKMLELSLGTPE